MVVSTGQRLFKLTAVMLIFILFLSACERPFQRESDTDTGPVEVATVAVPEVSEEVGETAEPVVVEEPEPTPTESQSPRPEPTETPPATPEIEAIPETVEEESEGDAADEEGEETDTDTEEGEAAEDSEGTDEDTADTAGEEEAAAVEVTPSPAPATQPGTAPTTHTVAAGENLYRIGLRYGVSWATLAQHNNLTNPNNLRAGQVLNIPGTAVVPISTPALETTYVVRRGDNLYRIGLIYGISWDQIAEANGIVNPNQVYTGQVLKIPVSAPGPAPQFTHVVNRGETVFLISVRYGVSWSAIAQANNLTPPYVIYPGQTLLIPGG